VLVWRLRLCGVAAARFSRIRLTSQLVRENRLSVVEDIQLDAPKTKGLVSKLKGMGLEQVLIITDNFNENLYLSSRNLENVMVLEAKHADPVSLVRFANVVLTKAAVKQFEEVLA
jgi:large subunit ribosomal protein L4